MRPQTFVLLRHGESEWNRAGRWQGHGGPGLTDLGRWQARAAARWVSTRYPDVRLLARSDLPRVEQTAKPLEDALAVPVLVDPRLRELDVGAWSGLTDTEVQAHDPEGYAAWLRGEEIRVGGGESRADLLRRVGAALRDLSDRLDARGGGTAVVVGHGGTVRAAAAVLLGREVWGWGDLGGVGNASVTELRSTAGDGELVSWAVVDHLVSDSSSVGVGGPAIAGDGAGGSDGRAHAQGPAAP